MDEKATESDSAVFEALTASRELLIRDLTGRLIAAFRLSLRRALRADLVIGIRLGVV